MSRLLTLLGMTVGGWAGWALGARWGIFAAIMLSLVGTAAGLYYGRKIARDYF